MGINSLQKVRELNDSYMRYIQITPKFLKEKIKKAEELRALNSKVVGNSNKHQTFRNNSIAIEKSIVRKPLFWKNYKLSFKILKARHLPTIMSIKIYGLLRSEKVLKIKSSRIIPHENW